MSSFKLPSTSHPNSFMSEQTHFASWDELIAYVSATWRTLTLERLLELLESACELKAIELPDGLARQKSGNSGNLINL